MKPVKAPGSRAGQTCQDAGAVRPGAWLIQQHLVAQDAVPGRLADRRGYAR
jgi:hypothetical protein